MHLFPRASFKQVDIPKKDHKAKKILRNGVSLYLPSSFKKTKPKLNKKHTKYNFFSCNDHVVEKLTLSKVFSFGFSFYFLTNTETFLYQANQKMFQDFFPYVDWNPFWIHIFQQENKNFTISVDSHRIFTHEKISIKPPF